MVVCRPLSRGTAYAKIAFLRSPQGPFRPGPLEGGAFFGPLCGWRTFAVRSRRVE